MHSALVLLGKMAPRSVFRLSGSQMGLPVRTSLRSFVCALALESTKRNGTNLPYLQTKQTQTHTYPPTTNIYMQPKVVDRARAQITIHLSHNLPRGVPNKMPFAQNGQQPNTAVVPIRALVPVVCRVPARSAGHSRCNFKLNNTLQRFGLCVCWVRVGSSKLSREMNEQLCSGAQQTQNCTDSPFVRSRQPQLRSFAVRSTRARPPASQSACAA